MHYAYKHACQMTESYVLTNTHFDCCLIMQLVKKMFLYFIVQKHFTTDYDFQNSFIDNY